MSVQCARSARMRYLKRPDQDCPNSRRVISRATVNASQRHGLPILCRKRTNEREKSPAQQQQERVQAKSKGMCAGTQQKVKPRMQEPQCRNAKGNKRKRVRVCLKKENERMEPSCLRRIEEEGEKDVTISCLHSTQHGMYKNKYHSHLLSVTLYVLQICLSVCLPEWSFNE